VRHDQKGVCRFKSKSLPIVAAAVALASLSLVSSGARANIIDSRLTNDMCGGAGCRTTPFGTVTVSSINSTTVDINVTLGPNNHIEVFCQDGHTQHGGTGVQYQRQPYD
jgi:hypothetical protein